MLLVQEPESVHLPLPLKARQGYTLTIITFSPIIFNFPLSSSSVHLFSWSISLWQVQEESKEESAA